MKLMNPFFPCFALAILLAHEASAEVPKKAPLTKYRTLWADSIFTEKPPTDTPLLQADVFEDYALAGVSPIKDGYRVTLIEKKDPSKRTYVYSDDEDPSHGFRIVSVERDNDHPSDTVVHLTSGSLKGSISYDQKLLTLAKPPAPKPTASNAKGGKEGNQPRTLPAAVGNERPSKPAAQPSAAEQDNNAGRESPRNSRPPVIGPPVNQENQSTDSEGRPTVRPR